MAPTTEPVMVGNNVTISTELGPVIGIQQDGFIQFKGIPFTEQAPVGDYRLSEVELKTSSHLMDPFPALSYGPSCMQTTDPTLGIFEISEDCLCINGLIIMELFLMMNHYQLWFEYMVDDLFLDHQFYMDLMHL